MRKKDIKRIKWYVKRNQYRRIWKKFVQVVACFVVFCTTYALILPAITLEKGTFCGIEDHEHVASCYEPVPSSAVKTADPVIHTHNEFCVDRSGQRICPLAELEEHRHSEACYALAEVETEPTAATQSTQPVTEATEQTQAAHSHDPSCYTAQRGALECTLPESPGHRHEGACYEIGGEPVCQQTEDPEHTHGDACYDRTLVCQLEEEEGHAHGDDCYAWENMLTCGLEETAASAAEAAPEQAAAEPSAAAEETEPETQPVQTVQEPERVLICTKPELIAHSHGESCYGTDASGQWALTCPQPEVKQHQHTESCLRLQEENRSCGLESDDTHQHSFLCYETWSFACQDGSAGQTEPLPGEDVETAEIWEQTFAEVTLTGVWPEDVLCIAQTQLGYTESEKNLLIGEDGTIRAYTRYGEWWGAPYGEWNTMFLSFCLHYAGVEDFPLSGDCDSWIEALEAAGVYLTPDLYIPKPGDVVFLDLDQKEADPESGEEIPVDADRTGIVAELIAPTDTQPAQLRTIEGDADGQVAYVTYELASPEIIGYGYLPEGPADQYACGQQSHSHGWMCYDPEGNLICRQPEHSHWDGCKACTISYADTQMRAELKIFGASGVPEDLRMEIQPVTKENAPAAYGAMYTAVGDAMLHSPYFVNDAVFYQLKLWQGEELYLLPQTASTTLRVTLVQPAFAPEADGENAQLRTFLLKEDVPVPEEAAPQTEQMQAMPVLRMAASPAEELPSQQAEEVPANYQAVQTGVSNYESTLSGASEIRISADNASVFGIALAATTQEGNFWKRVTLVDELTADGVYMIVSAEGNYALTRANTNGTKVYMDSIKGNTDYYEIKDANGNAVTSGAMRWTFSGSGLNYTVRNAAYSDYFVDLSNAVIQQERSGTWWWEQNVVADALTLTYLSSERGWRLRDDNQSLTNGGSTAFGRSNTTGSTSSMLIFKLVDTTLTIPDDVVTAPEIDGEGDVPEKPDYAPYLEVSGGKSGETSHASVLGQYYSDPATSQLETHFTGDVRENGMVHTDKSVIYGADDYQAFDSYEPNTFGVTLSALGQEFLVAQRETIETPVDVMFILDISGSMNANTVDSSGTTRTEAMVEAVNFSIAEIMEQNPNNRVGAVLYSTGTGDLLEMGRYYHPDEEYLKVSDSQKTWYPSSGTSLTGYFVELNSDLQKDGQAYSHAIYANQMNGTYTQAGIALGAQKLMATADTTCDVTVFQGTENETTVKVQRQPIIILLSDGEPTHCTSNYKDVLSGPHYGDGQASTTYQGVYGYYTILSANYYKRMVGIHYNTPALFYSVGMGISANGDEGVANVDGAHYKRTVLNPTAANVARNSGINTTNTTVQMRNLLNNSYNGEYITVTNSNQAYMPAWMGQVHADVPVLKNPYAGHYSYADNAYFGNYNAESLKGIFGDILEASKTISPFGFILRSRTSMDMEDPVGQGMELKTDPVLRYGGTNYTHTRKELSADGSTVNYFYDYLYTATDGSGDTADLSKIVVQVITDENGLQTVHMNIPDYIVPAYSPYAERVDEETLEPYFYYEALPARLIYQVGLTEASKQEVAELKDYGGELVYHTNRYGDTMAHTYLLPTNDNPFYSIEDDGSVDGHQGCHSTDKSANVTDTYPYSFECHHGEVDHWENGALEKVPSITQKLGNNGKLVFASERKVIDLPVEKKWHDPNDAIGSRTVDIELYSVVGETVTLVETMTLSQQNQWKGVFDRLPLLAEDGFYALREVVPSGFAVSYSGEVVEITLEGKPTRVVKIQGQEPVVEQPVTVTNSGAYVLPNTGGMGTQYHTFGGLLLMAAAAWMYIWKTGKQRQKGGRYPK